MQFKIKKIIIKFKNVNYRNLEPLFLYFEGISSLLIISNKKNYCTKNLKYNLINLRMQSLLLGTFSFFSASISPRSILYL